MNKLRWYMTLKSVFFKCVAYPQEDFLFTTLHKNYQNTKSNMFQVKNSRKFIKRLPKELSAIIKTPNQPIKITFVHKN
jgi:hypothetical protein